MNQTLPGPITHYRLPYPSKLTQKPPSAMTLIVGIKCKEAVIIAADSQISYGYSNLRTDIRKIERIDFKNMPALVALADNVRNAHRFIDILRPMAAEASPRTADEVALVVQGAMRSLRMEIRAIHCNCRPAALDKIIVKQSLNCSMTVAIYVGKAPQILQIDLLGCVCERSRAHYETDGCGADLADYILKEYHKPNEGFELTVLLATYVVWCVTKHDRHCRGPIVVGAVARPGGLGRQEHSRIIEFSRERVADLVAIGREIEAATRDKRNDVIRAEFEARAAEELKWIAEMSAELPPLTPEDIESMSGDPPGIPDDFHRP